MIKEVIVVEGKNDLAAVKKAVEAEVIVTGGFSLTKEVLNRIKLAQQRKGVIILTDPDHAGKLIRKRIKRHVPGCKEAYLTQIEAVKEADIGIENASPRAIQQALEKAKIEREAVSRRFSKQDLRQLGLLGKTNSSYRRELVGKELGIGNANGKQFLNRLNNYGIKSEELITAVEKVIRGDEN